jgi:putative lysine transport system permease protein
VTSVVWAKLGADIVKLWTKYGSTYLGGMGRTLALATIATFIGCLIGWAAAFCRPSPRQDGLAVKRFLLGLMRVILRIYVEVFRGTPMILQAVFIYFGLPYFSGNTMRFEGIWSVAIWSSPSTPAPIWPKRSAAASSPSTSARPRAPRPSA